MTRRDRAAEDLYRTAIHVAGHLVARTTHRLPLDQPQIRLRGRWPRRPQAVATPLWIPENVLQDEAATIDRYLVATLAGIEAEARWLALSTGVQPKRARRQAARCDRDGDRSVIDALSGQSRLSLRKARNRAANLIDQQWDRVITAADYLFAHAR